MKDKKNHMIRVREDTKNRLKLFKKNLEVIELDDIPYGEIVDRMSKGEDMLPRLRIGAFERKSNKK